MCEALTKVQDWFAAQHPDVQVDVAAFVVISLPGLDHDKANGGSDAMIGYVMKWLEPEQGSEMANFGKAISFGAAVDTFFADHFDDQSWERIQALNENLLQNPLLKDHAAQLLANLPTRAAAWKDAGVAWRDLAAVWLGSAGCQRFFAASHQRTRERQWP